MRNKASGLLFSGLLAVACGGGGGGSHSGGSGSSGVSFAANALVYGVANGTGTDFSVDQLLPGGSPTTVVADVSGAILLFALDPKASGTFAFAADATGAGTYGVYRASGLSLTGAKTLVSPAYASVNSLAVTPDGTRVVYTATTLAGASDLFTVPSSGGTPTDLGLADAAAVSPDGDTVAYVAPVGGSGDDQVFTRSLSSGAVAQVTTDAGNHALPAFSPNGTRLAYWTLASGANALFVRTLAGGATVSVPGVGGVEPQGLAFSPDGATVAFVGTADPVQEIATAPANGSAAPVPVLSTTVLLGNYGLFWTDANGRVVGGMRAGAGARARRLR